MQNVSFGQYCPVLKASDVLFEKWTVLILRELLLGVSQFNDLQRAIPRISPTLLTKRLRTLEDNGVILRKRGSGQRNYQYFLTAAGKELEPMIVQLANWGLRWALAELTDDERPIEYLMRKIQYNLNLGHFPSGETVILFTFQGAEVYPQWWLWVANNEVDLCTINPGKDVDLYVTADVSTLFDIWLGKQDIKTCINAKSLSITGDRQLSKTMGEWFVASTAATKLVNMDWQSSES